MNKTVKRRLIALVAMLGICLELLSGCSIKVELAPEETYDQLYDGSDEQIMRGLGLKKVLDVPGEEFKLVTEYSSDATKNWLITDDKFLGYNVYTYGLPEGTEVYVDNVHIDASIKSDFASINGVSQDSMDDHVHNSQMIGFSIDNDTNYYGEFSVEGSNDKFISGSISGVNGVTSGSISQKRLSEENYRAAGVTASKFQFAYDLLIKGPNDTNFKSITVTYEFLVPVTEYEVQYERVKYRDYEKMY